MTVQYGKTAENIQELRDFYNDEFKKVLIKDEDRAYRWMAHQLFRKYIVDKNVIDIGCGGGYFLKELSRIAHTAIGMDLSDEALRIASQENQNNLVQGSAEDLPFESGRFDSVFCLGSIEHFSDIPQALREMSRVTKKDGWIFLMVPNLFWYKDIISVFKTGNICDRNQKFEFFASPGQWASILKEAGLTVKKAWKYNGISKSNLKQMIKDIVIPFNLSYHIIFGVQS